MTASLLSSADSVACAYATLALRLLAQRDANQQLFLAALDQLHAAQETITEQQRQIAEMREERARLAREVFGA